MCLEDEKIGNLTRGNLQSVVAGTDPVLLLGGNNLRRTLILFPHATVNYIVQFDDNLANPVSFTIFAGNPPLKLHSHEDGDIVRRGIFVRTAAGGETIVAYHAMFVEDELTLKGVL